MNQWRRSDPSSYTDVGSKLSALEAEVERLTAELAECECENEKWLERYANLDYRLTTDIRAANAREKALQDVLNEAFRTETVRDLHDWLYRAKRGEVT